MNTVLFDLDGTLLPMDLKEFTDTYFLLLKNRMISTGYDADSIIMAIAAGQKAMTENDGMITNEECFWKAFLKTFPEEFIKENPKFKRKLEKEMIKFYKEDFGIARYITHPTEIASECIDILKNKGYQVVVATNPIFPEIATMERLHWAGLNPEEFSLITTYENSCYSKPNLNYYNFLLRILDKDPEDCLMVGNDVHEDMCARNVGMDVFLLNECEINEYKEDTFDIKKGNWKLFKEYISSFPNLE